MKDKDGYILVEKEFTLRGYRFKFVKQLKNSWCIYEKIKKELKVGEPFNYTQAGYEIEGIISEVTMDIYTGQTNHILSDTSEYVAYYDVMVTINGENSSVTLMNDGETYMLGDLWSNNDNVPESVKGVLDEIGYEIGDVLSDYVDSITHSYGLDSDSIDYNVVMEEEFNIERRKVD